MTGGNVGERGVTKMQRSYFFRKEWLTVFHIAERSTRHLQRSVYWICQQDNVLGLLKKKGSQIETPIKTPILKECDLAEVVANKLPLLAQRDDKII